MLTLKKRETLDKKPEFGDRFYHQNDEWIILSIVENRFFAARVNPSSPVILENYSGCIVSEGNVTVSVFYLSDWTLTPE